MVLLSTMADILQPDVTPGPCTNIPTSKSVVDTMFNLADVPSREKYLNVVLPVNRPDLKNFKPCGVLR